MSDCLIIIGNTYAYDVDESMMVESWKGDKTCKAYGIISKYDVDLSEMVEEEISLDLGVKIISNPNQLKKIKIVANAGSKITEFKVQTWGAEPEPFDYPATEIIYDIKGGELNWDALTSYHVVLETKQVTPPEPEPVKPFVNSTYIRNEFNKKLLSISDGITKDNTVFENVNYQVKPDIPYQKVRLVLNNSTPTIGSAYHRYTGYYEITLSYPRDTGVDAITTLSDKIAHTFRAGTSVGQQGAYIIMDKAPTKTGVNTTSSRAEQTIKVSFYAESFGDQTTPEPEPEPVEEVGTLKTIILGNKRKYDIESQMMKIVQEGEILYTAQLKTTGYNWISQNVETHVYDIPVGVETKIGVLGTSTLLLKSMAGNQITKLADGFEQPLITKPSENIDFFFTEEMNGSSFTELGFIIETGTSPVDPEPPEPPTGLKTENNYHVTLEEFNKFKKELYSIVAGEGMTGEGLNPAKYPSSAYVTSNKLYPFIVPDNELGESVNIQVKQSKLYAKGTEVKGSVITLDLGVVAIDRVFNNALDFLNTSAELFLPFHSSSINLDMNLVMGKKLRIIYEVVINSGDVTVNLIDDDAKTIVDIVKFSVGGDFPLYNATEQDEIIFTPKQAINNIRTAYVILSVPDYSQGMPKAVRKGNLAGVTGEVSATDMLLESEAYSEEKDMIEIQLSQGIVIK